MKVREIMTVDPICCSQSDSAFTAARLMKAHNLGAIPVLADEKSYELAGLVTDRDLCMAIVAAKKDPEATSLSECMASPVLTVKQDDDRSLRFPALSTHRLAPPGSHTPFFQSTQAPFVAAVVSRSFCLIQYFGKNTIADCGGSISRLITEFFGYFCPA